MTPAARGTFGGGQGLWLLMPAHHRGASPFTPGRPAEAGDRSSLFGREGDRSVGKDERRVRTVEEVVADVPEPGPTGSYSVWVRALRQNRSKPSRADAEWAPMMSRARAVDFWAALDAAASAMATRTEISACSS
jgi:hypothetical protein